MISSKSRAHRQRVLDNLAKCTAEREAAARNEPQMRMPLLVEVKSGTGAKQRKQRSRGRSRKDQPELGEW